jgi:STE24 endopeptidase
MYNFIFWIIISILTFSYILSQILDYLNHKNRNQKIPPELEGIFDAQKYEDSQNYGKAHYKLDFIDSAIGFVLMLLILFTGSFALLNNYISNFTENRIFRVLFFFGILLFLSDLIQTPFSLYSIFNIETKYGFNKMTIKTYITDKLKSYGLGLIIGGGILYAAVWFYFQTGENFWLYVWALITGFSVFMLLFYSNLIVPIFNKQTPLAPGELREAIENFGKKTGFQIKNIFVIDGSKRSTKANAYFTGLGPKKRIVLYDTLLTDLTIQETIAVLAHEIGHYKKRHTIVGLTASMIQTGLMLFIFSLMVENADLSAALGSDTTSFQLGLIAFGVLYSPISLIFGLFMNSVSRRNEYQADKFAADNGMGQELISGLKKLSQKNLSNLTPHPVYVMFNFSHPTLYQRIKAINLNQK